MRSAARSNFPPYRIDGHGDDAWASWTLLTNVPSANGIDPLSEERLLRARLRLHSGGVWALSTIETVEPKLLSLMNVRYLMSFKPLTEDELKKSQFTLGQTFPGRYLYENPNVLPRFFFVRGVVPSRGRDESLELINREEWDPARVAVVEGIDSPKQGLADGTVEVEKYANQEVILRVRTAGESFLSSSEVNYPGWAAHIDGMTAPIHYSNVAFRGIFVPAGDHRIVFRFRPAPLMSGAIVTLLTAISLSVGIYWSERNARRVA
jgi:Bacterial membrane protein YfhO